MKRYNIRIYNRYENMIFDENFKGQTVNEAIESMLEFVTIEDGDTIKIEEIED